MKLLIFSDTHLTAKFDQSKYDFLEQIISTADKVIINGDFWDSFLCSWDEFLASDWQRLFPLLKAKQTVYLFGNHDPQSSIDARLDQFCDTFGVEYKIEVNGVQLHCQHGQKISPSLEEKHHWLNRKWIMQLGVFAEGLGVRLMGRKFPKIAYAKVDQTLADFATQNYLGTNEILVCGHSHVANLNLEGHYANSGFIRHGIGQYLLVEDEMTLVDSSY